MKLTIEQVNWETLGTDGLVVPVAEGKFDELPDELRALVPPAAQSQFAGKLDDCLVLYPSAGTVTRLVLVGLGRDNETWPRAERFRRAVGVGAKSIASLKGRHVHLFVGSRTDARSLHDAVLISLIAPYRYEKHRTKSEDKLAELLSLTLLTDEQIETKKFRPALLHAAAVANAVKATRDLVNAPSNTLTPTLLAQAAKQLETLADTIHVSVLDEPSLEQERFGALLAVARGSDEEAQLITIDYTPKKNVGKTVALVGKGVTFDTGGVNLKPETGITGMHMDMAGAATVFGTIMAAAQLGLPIRIIGVIPATENMPSGAALKPGDVITARSGKTIEIANTDAEGRLILADGLDWALQFEPDLILDAATLTGAALVALGEERGAVIGNDEDLIEQLWEAGEQVGERIWELPLDDAYREHVKSEMADVRNLGQGRQAGTIAGAAFLEHFVPKETPWAHIDLAGPAMRSKATAYEPKGGTGWGVRLLVEFLTTYASRPKE